MGEDRREQEDIKARDEKYVRMTQAPVRQLVLRMAIPTTVSMVITAVYNLVDALFVGRLSTEATAGIGVGFAYMTFIQACGFFFGHGSGNFISRSLGERNYKEAEKVAAVGFFTPIIIGTIILCLFLPLLSTLSTLLGATPDILDSTNNYLRFIVLATPFMMSSLVLNNQLRLQGNARFAMIGLASGAVLNIILDPIFIFQLGWGVSGASAATCVSQLFAWSLLLSGSFHEGNVHIHPKNFQPTLRRYVEIMNGGLPSLCRQIFNCLSSIALNYAAAHYAMPGEEASTIAAFAVVSRVMMFAFSIALGLGQGFQPVCGFNYGAKRYGRVLESYTFTLKCMTILLTILGAGIYLFAPEIVALFRAEDPSLIQTGATVLRWQCISFPLVALSTATNMLFQNIRMTFPATLISMGRQGLFFLPTILILPQFTGIKGVEMTQAIADTLTFFLAIPYAVWIYQRLTLSEKENANDCTV